MYDCKSDEVAWNREQISDFPSRFDVLQEQVMRRTALLDGFYLRAVCRVSNGPTEPLLLAFQLIGGTASGTGEVSDLPIGGLRCQMWR